MSLFHVRGKFPDGGWGSLPLYPPILSKISSWYETYGSIAFAGTLGLRMTVLPRVVIAVISSISSKSCSPGTSVMYTGPPLRHLAAAWNPAKAPTVWNISQSGTTFKCLARIPLNALIHTCQPCAASFPG